MDHAILASANAPRAQLDRGTQPHFRAFLCSALNRTRAHVFLFASPNAFHRQLISAVGHLPRLHILPSAAQERPGGSSPCCRGGRLCVPRGPIGEHIEGFTVTGWFVLFIKPLRQEGAARFLAHDIHVNLPHVSAAPLSAQRRQKSRHKTHAI